MTNRLLKGNNKEHLLDKSARMNGYTGRNSRRRLWMFLFVSSVF